METEQLLKAPLRFRFLMTQDSIDISCDGLTFRVQRTGTAAAAGPGPLE